MYRILRIGGLASGLDVDSIVKDLMKVERMPVDRLKQQKQLLEWKREDLRAINLALLNFYSNEASEARLQATFLAKRVTSSDETAVTATASANAKTTTYTVTVGALATVATNVSTGAISANTSDKINPAATLWSQRTKFANTNFGWIYNTVTGETISGNGGSVYYLAHDAVKTGTVSISVDGTPFTVFYDQASYDASTDPNKVLVNADTGQLTFNQAIASGSTITAGYEYNTKRFSFSITTYNQDHTTNTKVFTVDATAKSLNDVLNEISSDTALGLTAFYESGADKVSIATTRTGDNNPGTAAAGFPEIQIGTTGFLAEVLKLDQTQEQGGTDASATINGLTVTRASNTFTLNEVTFTLKKVIATAVTINVETDVDRVYNSIVSFIEAYNSVLETINRELYEERFPDYLPLTDEQKEKLTDKEIEQWEEKARSGLLRNNSILYDIVSRLRSDVITAVRGADTAADRLAAIGITTGGYWEHGRLYIDEAKLKAAIRDNPDTVKDLFTRTGDTWEEQGVGQRVYATVKAAISQLTAEAGNPVGYALYDNSFLGRTIDEINERIDAMEERLAEIEDRYWRQFATLEQLMGQLNVQSAWLSQQFGQQQ
jgi:flagellar hook-associated protein 2